MKKEKTPKRKIKLLSINKMKLVLAVVMLVVEILAIIGSTIYGFHLEAVAIILFIIITFDYIQVLRTEMKGGLWYEIEDIEG